MDKIAEFVVRKRVIREEQKPQIAIEKASKTKLPWYKRPIERDAFESRKGKDNMLYIHHNEWAKKIWIGPYKNMTEVNSVIDEYVLESLKGPLNRVVNNNIHSVIIENEKKFF